MTREYTSPPICEWDYRRVCAEPKQIYVVAGVQRFDDGDLMAELEHCKWEALCCELYAYFLNSKEYRVLYIKTSDVPHEKAQFIFECQEDEVMFKIREPEWFSKLRAV